MMNFNAIKTALLSMIVVVGVFFSQNAFAQDSNEFVSSNSYNSGYTTIDNNYVYDNSAVVRNRVLTELGFSLLYEGAVLGLGTGMLAVGSLASMITLGVGFSLAPALAVQTSEAIWGGQGSLGWTYGGNLIGVVSGAALGSLSFLFLEDEGGLIAGLMFMGIFAGIGGIVGSILGYEITDKKNREASQLAIHNVRPVIQLSEERSVFGVGFDF